MTLKRMKDLRKIEAGGVSYGQVRDFLIDKGVIDMFKTGKVANPIKVASGLISSLIDLGVISGSGLFGGKKYGIFELIMSFFKFMNIRGFNMKDPNNLNDKNL